MNAFQRIGPLLHRNHGLGVQVGALDGVDLKFIFTSDQRRPQSEKTTYGVGRTCVSSVSRVPAIRSSSASNAFF